MTFKKGHQFWKHPNCIKSQLKKGQHLSPKTEFKKGLTPWNKDKKRSEELKRKQSKIMKGLYKEGKIKNPKGMLGKHHTEKHKRNMSLIMEDRKITWGNKISKSLLKRKEKLGYVNSLETRKKIKQARAKQIIPVKDTKIEVKIQKFLRMLGIEFFTHQYMKDIEHGYQCDIFVPSKNIVIECDGDYWHCYPQGKALDHIRTKELIEKGFKVLRLWEHEINKMDVNEFKNRLGVDIK